MTSSTAIPFNFTMKKVRQFTRFSNLAAFAIVILTSGSGIFAQTASQPPRQERLLNGLKLLMWSDPSASTVTVRIRIHSGAAFDPQGKEGVMRLLADNIFPTEAAREFFSEDLGGSLAVNTNYDYIQIDATGRSDEFLTILDTLAAALTNPTIDKPTTARLKETLLAEVKQLESDPAYVGDQAVAKRLFGTFPYGRPQFGSSESIAKIDFADLIDAKLRFLTADNATVSIYGNFDKVVGYRAARRYFGPWLKSDRRVPSTFRQPDPPPTALLTVPSPITDTSAIRFAMRGVARSDKDFAASEVYALILQERLRSRVTTAFSSRVFVRAVEHVLPGMFVIGFSAGKDDLSADNGKFEANELVLKALNDPITEAEFSTARTIFAAEWSKRQTPDIWLDIDTFKSGEPAAEQRLVDGVTLISVRAFADKIKSAPAASVLVNTPAN